MNPHSRKAEMFGFARPAMTMTTGNAPMVAATGEPMPAYAKAASCSAFEHMSREAFKLERQAFERMLDLVMTPIAFFVDFLMLAILVASLQGCASFTKPAREIRVTEYTGTASPGLVGAPYVSGDLVVAGCRLVLSKTEGEGCMRYKGKACSYASKDCAPAQAQP
jgi:hypothetical protein